MNDPYKITWRHRDTGEAGEFRCPAPCEYEARRLFGFTEAGLCPRVDITDVGLDVEQAERNLVGFLALRSLQRHGGDKAAVAAEMKDVLVRLDIQADRVRDRLARLGVNV